MGRFVCALGFTVIPSLLLLSQVNASVYLVSQFVPANGTTQLNHVALDRVTDHVYVAGVNRLYHLGPKLELLETVVTGPKYDSPLCHASGCGITQVDKVLTNNVNKVLVIDYDNRVLIACGSVSQGACEKYQLSNISFPPEFIARSVAANDPNSSTYAFIGPEQYSPWGSSNVLYIGTSFTNNGDFRHDVPAISSRNLYDLDFVEYSFSKQSLLRVDVKYRDHFIVKYVYGFSANNYAYFIIVQKRSHLPGQEEAGFLTRIARVCVADANYDSYTEVNLECQGPNGTQYNLVQDAKLVPAGSTLALDLGIKTGESVLVAVFSPSREHTSDPQPMSSLCVFTLKGIEEVFNENIHMCFNGTLQYRNLEYISGPILDGHCPKAGTTGNILDYCDVGLKLSGHIPIRGQTWAHFEDTTIVALSSTVAQTETVVFLATNDGRIKKILLANYEGYEYEEIDFETNESFLPDLMVDTEGQFLYALCNSKVMKIRVEYCPAYNSCSNCLKARDPYCGWCSLEKRCSVKMTCENSTYTTPRWLGSDQKCIEFEQVLPDRIPVSQMAMVQLTIKILPELPEGKKYHCIFGGSLPIDALVTRSGLSCMTPPVDQRPLIPLSTDHVSVPLAVRSSETRKDFVSRSFSYFNCSRHTTCKTCVKSRWACNWCVYDNRCTHNTTSCHRTVISGENNPAQLMSHGASYCPHFKPTGERTLLPSGVKKDIVLEVVNLPTPQLGQVGFQCIVEVEGTKYLVPGRVEASRFVVCEKTLYSYQTPVGELEGEVAVVWNKNHYVDRVTVTLYKCDILGSHRDHPDCSLCVTRPDKYRCSWCDDACSYSESCRHNPAFECPRPRIDVIKPLDGPMEGGSLVMIEGSNLGLKEEDVRGKISIGNIPCELVDYAVSVRIICRTGPAWQEMEAPVIVGNNVGFTESPVKFRYKNIQLIGLHPAFGPQSGGTLITVRGSHLNIGTSLKVFLGDHPCLVQTNQISSSSLQCVTSRSNGPLAVQNVTVQLDDARRLLSGHPYFYVMDPTVMEIKPLRSFQSGGRNLNIHGKNLNSIQKPELVVYLEGQHEPLNKTLCKVRGESFMECPSPPVDRTFLLKKRERREDEVKDRMKHSARLSPGMGDGGVNVRVGFIMDHVEAVRDLAKNFKSLKSQLVYVEDPIFHRFPEKVKSYKGDTLVIEGENLNLACDESDVNVTIGTQPCNVTSLALTQLVCTPPEIQPIPTNEIGVRTGTNLPMVVVRVGVNLRYTIGFLRYDMMKPYNFPPEAVGGIAAGGFFLVVVSLVILLVYRHKSSEAEREYKRIQIQMDSLECNVRQECKQAFAELQTDMTDLTADLETSGIPYLSRRTFIMKVFFPGVSEHPVLNDQKQRLSGPQTTYDMAMLQFEQILHNKLFLLAFIDTLESQKTFTIRDKVNVASLLMIILLNKMEYASDVLRSLLLRLIDKSIHTKYPQLMLRRTESVVEKMLTNWMAVCMFNYLKEQSGISLFLLYKAIKHQIQKGPVDSVTNDARYSLSEDRLLKEQIDHHVVTIHLVQEDPHYEKIPYPVYQSLNQQQDELDEKLQCKVLDCDTVSQVKSKVLDALYKNTPFSLRPSLEEVDLEWRPGRGSHLILSDEDLTTKTINGWKRVNTLSHYGIKECAIMSLLPRQATRLAGPCKFAGHSTLPWRRKGEWESMSPTFSVSSLAHVFSNGYIENGNATNMYHLVRYVDENHYFGPKADRGAKPIPELFLTRLLSTKGTLQKFVDDFFRTILSASQNLAPTVKWLFDLLDEAARRHNITDFEVVHSWKSNSLPLRFWVNLIKNPDFIFDVNKTPTEDSCLSVIAQTFMDACATTHHRLGKDSPSNKLLFAKDIPHYKDMVTKFYTDVAAQPKINDNQLRITLNELSGQCVDEFDKISALKELYIYVHKYYDQLATSLQSDPYCRKLKLAHNLEDVAFTLDGEPFRRC